MRNLLLLSMIVSLVGAFACTDPEADDTEQTYIPPDEEGNWILVDQIHTQKQNPDLRLERDNYAYQGMHGYHRLFKHIGANGYPYSQLTHTEADERLTLERLEGFKILFINLVSSDNPEFTADEIAVIHQWVSEGGGLFMITDHTNVYYHAQRVNPILEPMGIEMLYHTALDAPPEYAVQGGAWIKIRHYEPHPVTKDVKVTSFQTGGPFITEHGVGFLSDSGWGDLWIESEEEPGFYGNWRKEPGEPTGALPVIVAAEFGEGRVVVVGDQNIFGDEWVYVGQNFELAANSFEWLAQNENAEKPLRLGLPEEAYHVGVDMGHSGWSIGKNGCEGFFPFFINFNRTPQIVARGVEDLLGTEEALVYPDPSDNFTTEELGQVRAHVESGRPVVLLTNVHGGSGARQLLGELAPEFTLRTSELGQPLGLDALPLSNNDVVRFDGPDEFPVSSPVIDIDGLKMAGHVYPTGVRCSEGIEDSTPYLHRITSDWGEPFMTATLSDGVVVDIARWKKVGDGHLIVFIQDGFWRNETLGWERQYPSSNNADAHQVQYRFLDWLITQGPGAVE
jgi:hypothetical protein